MKTLKRSLGLGRSPNATLSDDDDVPDARGLKQVKVVRQPSRALVCARVCMRVWSMCGRACVCARAWSMHTRECSTLHTLAPACSHCVH